MGCLMPRDVWCGLAVLQQHTGRGRGDAGLDQILSFLTYSDEMCVLQEHSCRGRGERFAVWEGERAKSEGGGDQQQGGV